MKKVIPCPNDMCMEKMERGSVEGHIARDCGYTVISCKFADIGCEVNLKRHDMTTHEDDAEHHLPMALDAILKLKKTVAHLETKSVMLSTGEPVKLKITEFGKKLRNNKAFQSSCFYSNRYHMEIIVYANGFGHGKGRYLSIYIRILQGEYDHELVWPFSGSITITLLNQLADENHFTKRKHLVIYLRDIDGFTQGCSKFIPHSKLGHDPVKSLQYLKDDTLYFRILIQVDSAKHWLE